MICKTKRLSYKSSGKRINAMEVCRVQTLLDQHMTNTPKVLLQKVNHITWVEDLAVISVQMLRI